MSFKLQVVQEIEQGRISTYEACRKYGIQSRSTILVGFENLVTLIGKIKHLRMTSPKQSIQII